MGLFDDPTEAAPAASQGRINAVGAPPPSSGPTSSQPGGLSIGQLIGLALEGFTSGFLGRQPQGPAILQRRIEVERQAGLAKQKLDLERLQTVPHLLDSLSKTSALVTDPDIAKQISPIFQKLFKDVAGVDYPTETFQGLLLNPEKAEILKQLYPELESLPPKQVLSLAKNPAALDKLVEKKREQLGNEAFEMIRQFKSAGALKEGATLPDLQAIIPQAKYLTDEQKLSLGFPTKAVMEARAKGENKSPSIGADREAFALELFNKPYAELTQPERKQVNERDEKIQQQRLKLQQTQVNLQTTQQGFQQADTLRKEYLQQTKPFVEVRDMFKRVQSSAIKPSPAGDLSLIFAYLKMLDPQSVVRESEFRVAETARPLLEQAKISWDAVKAVWEGRRLTDSQRSDFINRAKQIYGAQGEAYQQTNREFRRTAAAYGLDPDKVVIDLIGRGEIEKPSNVPKPGNTPKILSITPKK